MVLVRILLVVVKTILCLLTANLVMIQNTGYIFWLCYLLAACYVALFGDIVGDMISLPFVIWRKQGNCVRPQITVCALCTLTYLIYGTVNMQTVTAKQFTFYSEKLRKNYRIAFLTDLHVGSAQSLATTEKTVRKIAAETPDVVLLGGDIVDEYTTKEEMLWVFSQFGAMDVPVYYIYGNHDRQDMHDLTGGALFTPEELEDALKTNEIQILRDEWIQISKDLVLFGREDISHPERQTIGEISERPKDAFVLLVDHSPYQTEEIKLSHADLQLSGHSHAGQLFPLQVLYNLTGYDACGEYHHGETVLYVTSGASGWCIPFRTEEGCHYEMITLAPEK